MKKTPVLVLAVALLSVACAPAAPATPGATSPATSAPAAATATSGPAPVVTQPPASAAATAGATVDYTGDFGGKEVAGTVKYCGATAHPYWAANLVSGAGELAFMSYLIPAGSTEPVAGIMDQPFMVAESNEAAAGTGQFVPGSPPHFIVVNNEGTHDITLKVGTFCSTQ
jgi:hypothetical protein